MGKALTYTLRNFAGGLDLREGPYSNDQNVFLELENSYVTNGRKIRRRHPQRQLAGVIDTATCQGYIYSVGNFYTIAKKGSFPANTVAAPAVTVLYFDNPDYCTTWTLLQAISFNGTVCALIRHTFPGATVTSRVFFHVFDGAAKKPTYVEDPYCPTSWAPNFPLHVFGAGAVGAYSNYTPRMGIGQQHVWIGRPDGNPHCSRTASPRYWNLRAVSDFLAAGEWWYFIIPNNGAPLRDFIVSEDFATLGNWAGYVLEYLDATGTWQKFIEDDGAGPPAVDKHYLPVSVASRFGAGNEIKLRVYWTGATDVVIRWRAVTVPPVAITSGATWTTGTNTLVDGKITFEGNNYPITGEVVAGFTDASVIGGATLYAIYYGVGPPGLVSNDAKGAFKIVTKAGGEQLNGWRRYHAYLEFSDFEDTVAPSSVVKPFAYPGATGSETPWYLTKLQDYTVNQAGKGDATFLNAATFNRNGGVITAISSIMNRMVFAYADSVQLWSIDPDSSRDAYLDQLGFGTGDSSNPQLVQFYNSVILPTRTGLRSLDLFGLTFTNLQDSNIGEPIERMVFPDLTAAAFWPRTGQYVTAGVLNGQVLFTVLTYSKASKINSWSTYHIAGIASIDEIVPVGDRLYFRSGATVSYLDATATVFRDTADPQPAVSNDPAFPAYKSRVRFHFNDFKKPGQGKRVIAMHLIQTGQCSAAFAFVPWNDAQIQAGPPVSGITYAKQDIPLAMWVQALSPTLESTDDTGWELQEVGFDFIPTRM